MPTEVRFPDGTRVRGAGLLEGRSPGDRPDRGLYLDPRWQPEWPATCVRWPDHGVPASNSEAVTAIEDAFACARDGERVEVGCYGGIGRTGTVLACMAVLAGVPGDAAVAWVRAHYHPYAVETDEQEGWVRWFAEQAPGSASADRTAPPRPGSGRGLDPGPQNP